MKRFVRNFIVAVVAIVFVNGQRCHAQVEIVDGNGKQVAENLIPTQSVEDPAPSVVPVETPEIFGGSGSSVIIRKSFSSVDQNGHRKTEQSGKAIVIGPDGQRQEFDLSDDQNLNLDVPGIEGLLQVPGIQPQAKSNQVSFLIGVGTTAIHPAVASQLNLDFGLMVAHVAPGSPATRAGVQKHDVLLFADDKQLISQTDLINAVHTAGEAGAGLSLTLVRGGKEISVVVTPEQRQADVVNQAQGLPNRWNLQLPEIGPNGIFGGDVFGGKDIFGHGIEDRMLQRMQRMRGQMRQFEAQIQNGIVEMP